MARLGLTLLAAGAAGGGGGTPSGACAWEGATMVSAGSTLLLLVGEGPDIAANSSLSCDTSWSELDIETNGKMHLLGFPLFQTKIINKERNGNNSRTSIKLAAQAHFGGNLFSNPIYPLGKKSKGSIHSDEGTQSPTRVQNGSRIVVDGTATCELQTPVRQSHPGSWSGGGM